MPKGTVIALSHGGGPMPVLNDPDHVNVIKSLRNRVPKILRLNTPEAPRAIVLVTAHWSTQKPTISSGSKHKLLYDYHGFPAEAYRLKYDAPGSPEVAKDAAAAMLAEGLDPVLDDKREWDHGVFVPMLLIHPAATIPIVQISVLGSESATAHATMGRALARLRDSNIAIIGSGFASLHNLRLMFSGEMETPGFRKRNDEWSRAVTAAMEDSDVDRRASMLETWRKWPNAYEMHPRGAAEHFLPLIVASAAGGEGAAKKFKDEFTGLDYYTYYWD